MVEVVVLPLTFGRALAGLTRDYHFLSFKVVVATLLAASCTSPNSLTQPGAKTGGVVTSCPYQVPRRLYEACNDLIHCVTFLRHSESPFRAVRSSKILSLTMVQFYGGRSVVYGFSLRVDANVHIL